MNPKKGSTYKEQTMGRKSLSNYTEAGRTVLTELGGGPISSQSLVDAAHVGECGLGDSIVFPSKNLSDTLDRVGHRHRLTRFSHPQFCAVVWLRQKEVYTASTLCQLLCGFVIGVLSVGGDEAAGILVTKRSGEIAVVVHLKVTPHPADQIDLRIVHESSAEQPRA